MPKDSEASRIPSHLPRGERGGVAEAKGLEGSKGLR